MLLPQSTLLINSGIICVVQLICIQGEISHYLQQERLSLTRLVVEGSQSFSYVTLKSEEIPS